MLRLMQKLPDVSDFTYTVPAQIIATIAILLVIIVAIFYLVIWKVRVAEVGAFTNKTVAIGVSITAVLLSIGIPSLIVGTQAYEAQANEYDMALSSWINENYDIKTNSDDASRLIVWHETISVVDNGLVRKVRTEKVNDGNYILVYTEDKSGDLLVELPRSK